MTFKKYSPRMKGDRPIISISRRRFQLNRACREEFFKGKDFVELFYDEEDKVIGIKPLAKETKDSIMIRRYDWKGITVISAGHFISSLGLDKLFAFDVYDEKGNKKGERSIQVPAEWDEKHKIVILRLK